MTCEIKIREDKNLVEVKLSGFMSLKTFRKEGQRLGEYAIEQGK